MTEDHNKLWMWKDYILTSWSNSYRLSTDILVQLQTINQQA
jgi:hypothetical protein